MDIAPLPYNTAYVTTQLWDSPCFVSSIVQKYDFEGKCQFAKRLGASTIIYCQTNICQSVWLNV